MNCNYKVKITDIQNKYQFKILCKGGANSINVNDIYNLLPTTTTEGDTFSIANTSDIKAKSISIKGNTSQASTPTPTNPVDVKVVTGTNTINISNRNLSSGWEYGDIVSTTGVESDTTGAVRLKNYIPYDTSTTYRLSVNGSTPNASTSLRFYNKNKEYIGYAQLYVNGGSNFTVNVQTSVSDTTPKYIRLRMASTVATPSDKIMLTNTSDITYVEHQEKSYTINLGTLELCKFGTYQDYLYKSNNKWFIHKITNRKDVVGNDITSLNSKDTTTGVYQYRTANGYLPDIITSTNPWNAEVGLCNYFKKDGNVNNLNSYCFTISQYGPLAFNSPETSLANFKAWVDSVDLKVYYVKETATDIEITDTTLIKQLNNITNNIRTFEGTTNIDTITDNEKPIISITTFNKLS